MNTDFENDVELFDDDDIEELFWLNRITPKKMREKDFKVKRNRPVDSLEF